MDVVGELYRWTNLVLQYGVLALATWALIDCVTRRASAFPAANKLTKPAWLLFLALACLISYTVPPVTGIISFVGLIVVSVYLVDVRPAVRELGPRR